MRSFWPTWYWIAMAIELIPVEPHRIFLTMNYLSHLLFSYTFYWARNRIWDLVISLQNIMHEVWQSKAHVEDSHMLFIIQLIKRQKSHIYLRFHAIFLLLQVSSDSSYHLFENNIESIIRKYCCIWLYINLPYNFRNR